MNKQNYNILLVLFLILMLPSYTLAIEAIEPTVIPTIAQFRTLTVNAQGGQIVSEPDGIDCENKTCTYTFVKDSYVALAAVAAQDFDQVAHFNGWSGDCSNTNEVCRIQMTADKTVTASFGALIRPIALFTLTVNVGGMGTNVKVVSDPPGIDCTAADGTCSAEFDNLTSIALSATGQDTSNGYISGFVNWTGDCTSSTTACNMPMGNTTNKTVNANYLVGVTLPAFAKAAPVGANKYYHHPRVDPSVSSADDIQPFGLGQKGNDLKIKLPEIVGPVDVYLAITVAGNDSVFLMKSDNTFGVLATDGLVAWKSAHNGDAIDETIFANLLWGLLPAGTYNFYVMVTKAGNTTDYYLWKSYRNNHTVIDNPFLN